MDWLVAALQGGFASLASYLAAHVLLCLVPAFFVAGALSALVPQASIVRFLGPGAPKRVAYPAAAGAGSLLAVCSCTVQPLFAGIYRQGAGLGPAVTFMFFAPAANVLALAYTGVTLGAEFAFARVLLSLVFGIGIGLLMATWFHREEAARATAAAPAGETPPMPAHRQVFVLVLVALLIGGTLKLAPLTTVLWQGQIDAAWAARAQAALDRLLPVDPLTGAEGLTLQGAALIVLLVAIGATAWRGLGHVDEGLGALGRLSLGLVALTLVFAVLRLEAGGHGLQLAITGRSLAVASLIALLWPLARCIDDWDRRQWLWESWRFARQIFPLLVVGVFVVGVVRVFIRPEWVQAIAGENSLAANLAAVLFGVFMYFPTLVEVPVAKMLLDLGMHPGPLLAYLMSDPELSLQSMLITASIIGRRRTAAYVVLVALAAATAGMVYGAWVDGLPAWRMALPVIAVAAALAALLYRRERMSSAATT